MRFLLALANQPGGIARQLQLFRFFLAGQTFNNVPLGPGVNAELNGDSTGSGLYRVPVPPAGGGPAWAQVQTVDGVSNSPWFTKP